MKVPVMLTQVIADLPLAKENVAADTIDSESSDKDVSAQQPFLPMLAQMIVAGAAGQTNNQPEGGQTARGSETSQSVQSTDIVVDLAEKNMAGNAGIQSAANAIVSAVPEALAKLANSILGARMFSNLIPLAKEAPKTALVAEELGAAGKLVAVAPESIQAAAIKNMADTEVPSLPGASIQNNIVAAHPATDNEATAGVSAPALATAGDPKVQSLIDAKTEASGASIAVSPEEKVGAEKFAPGRPANTSNQNTQLQVPVEADLQVLQRSGAQQPLVPEEIETESEQKSLAPSGQGTSKVSKNESEPLQQKLAVSVQKDSGQTVSETLIRSTEKGVPRPAVAAPHALSPELHDHARVTSTLVPERLVPEMTLRMSEQLNPQHNDAAAGGDKQHSARQELNDSLPSGHESSTTNGEVTANKTPAKVAAGSVPDAPAPSTTGNQSAAPVLLATHPQLTHGATDGVQGSQSGSLPPEMSRSVVAQIAQELQVRTQQNSSEIKIMLKPESLGEVFLKVKMEDGKMTAQIDVNQANVKVALESNLPQLHEILISHGIDIDHIDIIANGQFWPRESNKDHADKSKQHGKRRATDDTIERYERTRSMGYNTVEYIM